MSALNEENSKQEWAKYCSISAVEVGLNKENDELKRELVFDLDHGYVKEKASFDVLKECKHTREAPAPVPEYMRQKQKNPYKI